MARVSDWRRVADWSLESGRGSHRAQLPRLCPDPWPGQMFRLMLRRQLVFSISDLHVQCVLRVLNVKYMINTCSKSALCEIKGRVVARLLIYWPNQTRCCQAANDLLTIVRVINNPSLMFNARNSDKLYLALFSVMRHNTKTFVLSLPRSQWCSAKSAVPRRHHITSHHIANGDYNATNCLLSWRHCWDDTQGGALASWSWSIWSFQLQHHTVTNTSPRYFQVRHSWQVQVYFMHMKEADLLSLNMSSWSWIGHNANM